MSPAEEFEAKWVHPAPAGRVLIAGSRVFSAKEDRRTRYPGRAVGIDMEAGDGVDMVLDLEGPLNGALGQFTHIECLSVLEHSRAPWALAANLERLLLPGGTLFLSVPFVWRVHQYPGDLWRFTDQGVRALFPFIDWEQIAYASDRLRPDHYIKAHEVGGHPMLPRTEVLGWGRRQ